MACSLNWGSYLSGFNGTVVASNSNRVAWFGTSLTSLESKDSTSKKFPLLSIDFVGKPLVVPDQKGSRNWSSKPGNRFSVQVCANVSYSACFTFWILILFLLWICLLGSKLMLIRLVFQARTACVSRAMRWWEKNLKPNMVKIHSADELVDSLQNAGDRLVIIDFYSPGCGGCKALHPKVCLAIRTTFSSYGHMFYFRIVYFKFLPI